MKRTGLTLGHRLCLICGALGSGAIADPAAAQSGPSFRVDASAGVRYDSNPYLLSGPSTGSASADGQVRPSITLIEQQGRLTLEGLYRRQEYLHRYPGTDSFGGTLSGNYRFNSELSLTSSVSYMDGIIDADTLSSENLFLNGAGIGSSGNVQGTTPVVQPPVPTGLVDPLNGDVGLIGLRQRRSQLAFATTVSLRPNPKDAWSVGVSGNRSKYPGSTVAANYRSYGANASYSRTLSETSSLGASLAFEEVDYSSAFPASRIYSPQVTYTRRLRRDWSIDGGIGASIFEGDRGVGQGTSTTLFFQLNACRSGLRSKFCLGVTRSAAASAVDGVGPQISGRLSYSYRLNERTTFTADGTYNRVSETLAGSTSRAQQFAVANLGVRRDISRRVQLFGAASYQARDSSTGNGRRNVFGALGVAFSLGSRS